MKTRTYYISRDSLDGNLYDDCSLWWKKPRRRSDDGMVTWSPKIEAAGYFGEYSRARIKLWFGTCPETDLELIVVEQNIPPAEKV